LTRVYDNGYIFHAPNLFRLSGPYIIRDLIVVNVY